MTSWAPALSLALATLASEDLAALAAGMLAARGDLDVRLATAAVMAGIYAGDLLLFLCGRAARRTGAVRRWMLSRWRADRLERLGRRLDAQLPVAIIGSRFVPGSRLPMYLAAGLFSRRPVAFCVWTALAVCTWTLLLISGVMLLGRAFETSAQSYVMWAPVFGALAAGYWIVRLAGARGTRGRE